MGLITHIADKAGTFGSVVSVVGYAACFPTITSLGAIIGPGFLREYEGLLISMLLPLFAVVALLANALGQLGHRQWRHGLLGMIGPAIVFIGTVWLLGNWWTVRLVYAGLVLMISVSIWGLVSPTSRRRGPDGYRLPTKHGWQREPAASAEKEQ